MPVRMEDDYEEQLEAGSRLIGNGTPLQQAYQVAMASRPSKVPSRPPPSRVGAGMGGGRGGVGFNHDSSDRLEDLQPLPP